MRTLKWLPALLSVFVLSSCNQASDPRAFADRFIAAETHAWSTGDVESLKAIESPDVIYHLPGTDLKGWQAHEDFIVNGRATVEQSNQSWTYLSGNANLIALAYSSSATLKPTDTAPAQDTSNDFLFVLRIENDRVAEVWANGSATSKPVE